MSEIFFEPVPLTEEEIVERKIAEQLAYEQDILDVKDARQFAYQKTADPLFFKYQAGEATKQEWLNARALVVEQHPYPKEN